MVVVVQRAMKTCLCICSAQVTNSTCHAMRQRMAYQSSLNHTAAVPARNGANAEHYCSP